MQSKDSDLQSPSFTLHKVELQSPIHDSVSSRHVCRINILLSYFFQKQKVEVIEIVDTPEPAMSSTHCTDANYAAVSGAPSLADEPLDLNIRIATPGTAQAKRIVPPPVRNIGQFIFATSFYKSYSSADISGLLLLIFLHFPRVSGAATSIPER